MTTQSPPLTQDEIIAKLYRDMTRLAAEIALDRCRNRVLMTLVKERLNITTEELDDLLREEVSNNLEPLCNGITKPMLAEWEEPAMSGPCGCQGCH